MKKIVNVTIEIDDEKVNNFEEEVINTLEKIEGLFATKQKQYLQLNNKNIYSVETGTTYKVKISYPVSVLL